MAAAYLFHLCQNHAFIDGNKRVCANAAITFFLMNNFEPAYNEEELADLVLAVASRGSRSLHWSPSSRPVAGSWRARSKRRGEFVGNVVPRCIHPPVGTQ
jgi:prophage maintenance system killer protein